MDAMEAAYKRGCGGEGPVGNPRGAGRTSLDVNLTDIDEIKE